MMTTTTSFSVWNFEYNIPHWTHISTLKIETTNKRILKFYTDNPQISFDNPVVPPVIMSYNSNNDAMFSNYEAQQKNIDNPYSDRLPRGEINSLNILLGLKFWNYYYNLWIMMKLY